LKKYLVFCLKERSYVSQDKINGIWKSDKDFVLEVLENTGVCLAMDPDRTIWKRPFQNDILATY
jgi:hypothetical protein